jgi:hypothetical protein
MVKTQQLWVVRAEGGEDVDFETVHATEMSAYINVALLLRDDWATHFTERCPIDYHNTEPEFIESVKKAMNTWHEFRRDEGAFREIMLEDAPSTKWSAYSYEVKQADTVEDNKFGEHQGIWLKADGFKLGEIPK